MTCMQTGSIDMDSVLIDTNILVYAYDQNSPLKQRRAINVLEQVRAAMRGVVTAQVLAEFYAVTTRKLSPPLTSSQAEAQLRIFAMQWPVLSTTDAVVFLAVCGTQTYHMHFRDAQIWAAARLYGIMLIYSEGFDAGSVIEGVRFVNPLAIPLTPG